MENFQTFVFWNLFITCVSVKKVVLKCLNYDRKFESCYSNRICFIEKYILNFKNLRSIWDYFVTLIKEGTFFNNG